MMRDSFDRMPAQTPNPYVGRDPFVVAIVRRTHVFGRRIYVDALDPTTGETFGRCPLMAFGGGPDRFMLVPVAENEADPTRLVSSDPVSPDDTDGAQVLLLRRRRGRPYAIGTATHVRAPGLLKQVADDPGAADHAGGIGKNDFVIRNAQALLIVDENGAVTVIAGKSKRVRVQVPDGGTVRISHAGEADERVLLADKFCDSFVNGDLRAYLDAQDARISALETALQAVITAVAGGHGLVPFTATGSQTVPTAGNDLRSGVITISAKPAGS